MLEHGTGAINVDGCRVGTGADKGVWPVTQRRHSDVTWTVQPVETDSSVGRWPANLIHDSSEEVTGLFPNAGGGFGKRGGKRRDEADYGLGATMETVGYGDSGSAARFFYCAKASKRDRDEGLEGFEVRKNNWGDKSTFQNTPPEQQKPKANHHPTVKPTDLMRYLCRLVTPPGGVVLDPFTGSGSTGKAALLEGFEFIGIEREAEYVAIAEARIRAALETKPLI